MTSDRDQGTDDCGACGGIAPATPRPIGNRPGLAAIAYRVATHADVVRSLEAALSDVRRPALATLRTREATDFTIALFDAFACMVDVLAFYQERIANELFLRTATERRSLLELARLLGYELRPGVAASTYLAFRLEQGQGAPERAPIPIGTRAQSLPGPGELPQTFETVEPIEDAVGEWNELRARTTRRQAITPTSRSAYVQGAATGVVPGDPILLVDTTPTTPLYALRTVRKVTVDAAADRTLLAWDGPDLGLTATELHVLRQRAALFGHNAPDWRAMPKNVQQAYLGLGPDDVPPLAQTEWPGLAIGSIAAGAGLLQECHAGTGLADLRETRVDPRVEIAGHLEPPVPGIGDDQFSSRWTGVLTPTESGNYTFHVRTDDGARLYIDEVLVIDSWVLQSPTEHASAPIALVARRRHAIRIEFFENFGGAVLELRWTTPAGIKERVPRALLAPFDPGTTVQLDALYPKLAPQSWLVLAEGGNTRAFRVESAVPDSRSRFTLSSKTTRVVLSGEGLPIFDDRVRSTVVLAQSEPLTLAEMPDTSPVERHVDLDRLLATPPARGRQVLVAGTARRTGSAGSIELYMVERAVIDSVVDDTTGLVKRSRLVFQADLAERYVRDSVRVYGNVALATHGETVPLEVLGSGDAGRSFQRFTLRNGPLTYTPAPVPSGGASTLTVRVDGIEWTGVPALFGRGPAERVYTTRLSDDAQTTVQLGDGRTGARLPTGTENVVARLRKGLGAAGNLPAGRLTLLPSRPHGVKDVTNPWPAEGGQDPQTLADARQNVPRSAITLERIVSLRDYEDFARDFAGIGKALASITVRRESLGVLLTIAGPAGEEISPGSQLRLDLLEAIAGAGDRAVAVDARSYRPRWFRVGGGVVVAPEHDPDVVIARIQRALAERFSFAAREFGQPVARSQVIGVIQGVPGIVMVDLQQLAREDGAEIPGHPDFLPCDAPAPYSDAATVEPAELLLLRDGGVDLEVIS